MISSLERGPDVPPRVKALLCMAEPIPLKTEVQELTEEVFSLGASADNSIPTVPQLRGPYLEVVVRLLGRQYGAHTQHPEKL